MNGVVLEEVAQVVEIHEWVVDGHHLGLVGVGVHGSSEGESTDSAEAVDSEFDAGHSEILGEVSFNYAVCIPTHD